jgi:hypothetical protein
MSAEDRAVLERFKAWKHRKKGHNTGAHDDPRPQEVYSELMKNAFAPALREAGLKGSGARFELPSERFWAQLGFQKSAYSDGLEVRFTVNLSVIRRDEWEKQTSAKPHLGERPTPSTHYGTWADQVRLAQLTPESADKWWRIVRGVDSSEARDDAVHDLLTYGVPWLRERVV